MRNRRSERGALTLASAEVKFQIDTETHDPLDIGICFCIINYITYPMTFLGAQVQLNWYFFKRNVSNSGGKSDD